MRGETPAQHPAVRMENLVLGGPAAVLGSSYCLEPLVLVLLDVDGAWIGNLTRLEPDRSFFLGAALIASFFAWRRIFGPARACTPDEVCTMPRARTTYKVIFWCAATLVLVAFAFPYAAPLFY